MPLEKFSEKRREKDEERETEKGRELGKQKELVLCKPGHTKLGEKEITGSQRVTEQYLQAPILWHKNACYLKLSHLCAVEQNPLGYLGQLPASSSCALTGLFPLMLPQGCCLPPTSPIRAEAAWTKGANAWGFSYVLPTLTGLGRDHLLSDKYALSNHFSLMKRSSVVFPQHC